MSGRHWWLAGLGLVLVSANAGAQNYRSRYRQFIEPQWLRLQLTDAELGLYAEGSYEETTALRNGRSSTYERYFLGPSLSLAMQGSIYHPNFLTFQLAGEGSYGWAEQFSQSGSRRERHENWQVFGNYQGTAAILPDKPVNGTLYSNYGRSYREYDFFTQATVDTLGYGSRINYQNPRLSVLTTYAHTDETLSDTTSPYSTEQDLVSFDARNDRGVGGSTFNYTFNQSAYSRGAEITDHTINVSDSERLNSQMGLGLGAGVGRHESGSSPPEYTFSGSAGLNWEHDRRWASDYSVNYDRFEAEEFTSQTYAGQAGVQHKLYDSLFSALRGNASAADSTAADSSGYTRRYGAVWTEGYSKKIGAEHRFGLDGSFAVSHTDQKSTGRAVNESYTFPVPPEAESFLLNQLNVDEATIIVADSSQLITYIRGLDYDVFVNGSLTEIRRRVGGGIPQGATVRVDYQAQPTPAGRYETFSESVGVRLDLWKNLLGFYARYTHVDNNAPPDIRTLNSSLYTVGSDVSWRWLRTGVEYQRNETSESVYWSARAFQSGQFTLDPETSLSASFTESYSEYVDVDRQEQNYSFTTSYHRSLSRGLRADVRGGVNYRLGEGVDQTLAVFRPELHYNYGRTTIQFAYSFEYSLYLESEERHKHLFTLRVRRNF